MQGDSFDRRLVGYLGGVLVLAGAVISMLLWLFFARVPAFPDAVVRNPGMAVRAFPVTVVLLVGVFVGTLLLIGLVVGFGARYGPEDIRSEGEKQ
jgi:low affinity Fe/Cu permease